MKIKKSFKFRMYPSKKNEIKLVKSLEIYKKVYNEMLNINNSTYEMTGKGLTKFDMNKSINHGIDFDISNVHSQVLQNVCDRLDKSYKNFFRRVKEKKKGNKIKVGYPRYKKQYKSFTYPQSGYKFEENKLSLSKIGIVNVRIGKKQNIPKGKIKTCTIKRESTGKWFVIFSSIEDVEIKKNKNNKKVGIDVGLKEFATLSNGEIIKNNRFLEQSEKKLKKYQRRLSRKEKKSRNRLKARQKLALIHEKIKNQRYDFHHKISSKLINDFGTLVIEDLNIRNMVKHPYLSKSINDASWNQFFNMLSYKAESAGKKVIKVDPKGTTQNCSNCKNKVQKSIAVRFHRCSFCGIEMDRDLNASINILNKSTEGTSGIYACGDGSSFQDFNDFENSSSKKQEAIQLVGW